MHGPKKQKIEKEISKNISQTFEENIGNSSIDWLSSIIFFFVVSSIKSDSTERILLFGIFFVN